MTRTLTLLAACAITIAPTALLARPGNTGGSGQSGQPTDTGQPNASCEDAGVFPGQSDQAPGTGSPFIQDGPSVSGSHYAGEQAQNTINDHTVSQYDVACLNQLARTQR